ncbi:MAG: methyltransferase domain-containing protein, partial [Oscillospiraceae bacterium]|nr:methyltransferase domain-containing protein [Oscillospiraceae bacterium]
KNGLFYVQDPAAKMAIMAAAPKTGDKVIDVCAAPGGKSIAAAMLMNGIGEIYSYDIGEKKLPKIIDSANRLGIEIISVEKADGREFIEKHEASADVVIADVPCSGFGVIRKKPEIRYKDYKDISGLPEIQLAILKNASSYVKPNGVLLYSTCTVLSEENGDVVSKFLQDNDKFIVEDFEIPVGKSQNGMMTLYPHIHDTDGFFICKLRRVK